MRKEFGADVESTDALTALLRARTVPVTSSRCSSRRRRGRRNPSRAAALFRKVGDVHRHQTRRLDEAVAAYDLSLEQDVRDTASREGLEALVDEIAADDAARKGTLTSAVASLCRVYATLDDVEGTIRICEKRLAVAASDRERVSILAETAGLAENRREDVDGAFSAMFRAFQLEQSQGLGVELTRLAGVAGRWPTIAEALAGGLVANEGVPRDVARELFWNVGAYYRDERHDLGEAEAAFTQALARDPESVAILEALVAVQRENESSALVGSLLRLAEAKGQDLNHYREAVSVAERSLGDRLYAKTLAAQLLEAAKAAWSRADAGGDERQTAEAAQWAVETLVRLSEPEGPEAVAGLLLEGAKLRFGSEARRSLRLRAADLLGAQAKVSIYEELFEEDPGDVLVGERLAALYRETGRAAELVALCKRQIATLTDERRRSLLRYELALLLIDAGDTGAAIRALEENLRVEPRHAPSIDKLADLLEGAERYVELVTLLEARADEALALGENAAAATYYTEAATLLETKLGERARAIAAHRKAFELGNIASEDALARLLSAAGILRRRPMCSSEFASVLRRRPSGRRCCGSWRRTWRRVMSLRPAGAWSRRYASRVLVARCVTSCACCTAMRGIGRRSRLLSRKRR